MEGLKGIMKRPNGQNDDNHRSLSGSHKNGSVKGSDQLPSLSRDDHPAERNLLGNSLSARLRKSLSGNARKSFKKTYNGQVLYLMQTQNAAVDPDIYEKIRQQQQIRKHNEWSRKKQEKLQARLMTWATEAGRHLPEIGQNGVTGSAGGKERGYGNGSALEMKDRIKFDDFPRAQENSVVSYSSFLGDDSVRVMKKDGVFRPVNKYIRSRDRRSAEDLPFSDNLINYETVTLPFKEGTKENTDMDIYRKKPLSVSWSAHSYKTDPTNQKQSGRDSKVTSAKSFASEPASWKRPLFSSGKNRVDGIGVKWKLPLPKRPKTQQTTQPKRIGVSRDLTPVTSGLDREGTSLEKIRWKVVSTTSPGSAYGMDSSYDLQRSLRTMRHMSFRTDNSSPRKVTFSDKSVESVVCESG